LVIPIAPVDYCFPNLDPHLSPTQRGPHSFRFEGIFSFIRYASKNPDETLSCTSAITLRGLFRRWCKRRMCAKSSHVPTLSNAYCFVKNYFEIPIATGK
jgi:hypothetical protein